MKSAIFALTCAAIALTSGIARASLTAYDTAGDSAYNNGWTQGSNGGFGWASGWSFDTFGTDSTAAIAADPNNAALNSPASESGRAWRFSDISPMRRLGDFLAEGQTISIDLDDPQGIRIGLAQYGSEGTNSFYIYAAGRTYWSYVFFGYGGIPGNYDTHIPVVNGPVEVSMTDQGHEDLVAIRSLLPGGPSSSGTVDNAGGFDNELEIDAAASDIVYANNLSVTPEPSTICLCCLASAGLLARGKALSTRRRR